MQTLREFKPTPFDSSPAAFIPDQSDWIVAPVSRTRDSGALDQSNFEAALAMLGGESDTVEVHRFGHWGPGWFEIIICAPEHEGALYDMERALADYPLLDEEDFCNREHEEYMESWGNGAQYDFSREVERAFRNEGAELSDLAIDVLQSVDTETIAQFHESLIPSGEYYNEGWPCIRYSVESMTRRDLARFLWANRNART